MTTWPNRIIRWGFYLLFALVPIILTPWNFELFEYNKMMLTYALTTIIVAAWAVKMIQEKQIRVARTPFDIPILVFLSSQLLSTLFSIDPHVSWFGYYSRFNGGMFSIISYVFLYYAYISNGMKPDKVLKIMLTTGAVVALYGFLEHFGIDKHLWVQDVQSRVFSTLGQPNWLAAYLVALIPLSFAFGMQAVYYYLLSLLFFVVLLYTRSRSGYLGFALADVVFWVTIFLRPGLKKPQGRALVLVHVALFLCVIFIGTHIDAIDNLFHKKIEVTAPVVSGTALETGGTESGTIRKYVWQGAINAWRGSTKNVLIGTGTETFAFAFYQYRPVAHNMTSEWDFLYNKAHNEYLNYITTTGIFGLGSYLIFIATVIIWFIKNSKNPVTIALFSGWMSILVTNFFGFSVVTQQLAFFLFPALILGEQKIFFTKKIRIPPTYSYVLVGAGLFIVICLIRFWKADTLYALGSRLGRSGNFAKAQELDMRAIALNRGEPLYHDDLSSVLANLSIAAAEGQNATLAASLAKKSLEESDYAISTSPHNVNFWKTRTKVYYTLSSLDPTLMQSAIDALTKSRDLSPNDPKIYYNLAILQGRMGQNDEALTLLSKAKELKPNYRDAYFGLYVFYTEIKKTDLARAQLQDYLTNVDPNDKDFQERLQ